MSCCVVGCKNRYGKKDLHLYRIPSTKTALDAERRSLWLQAINRSDWPEEVLRNARVCSAHFVSGKLSMDPQSPDFVPSVFPPSTSYMEPTERLERFSIKRRKSDGFRKVPLTELASYNAARRSSTVKPTTNSPQPSANPHPVSLELHPSLQRCLVNVIQIPLLMEKANQTQPQVKEEPVDEFISPDLEADGSSNADVRLPESEPTAHCELLPSSPGVTVSIDEDIHEESDVSSSSLQSYSVEVYFELEQPPRDDTSCRFCGKLYQRDSHLIRHVERAHKGHRAFKCTKCDKEFEQRHQLIQHVRMHTGEKPFSCDYCEKTFTQNSSRIVHMRIHTGEKPYFCKTCGKNFPSSRHFKMCNVRNGSKIAPGKLNENQLKPFKCLKCPKSFKLKYQLILHTRVHTGEKPFSCDFCGKTFSQNSSRIVHMRQHTGEKPYFCKKCGKWFALSSHLKRCTETRSNGESKPFRCTVCGKRFRADSDLGVHMEVHESWRLHLSEKWQGRQSEEDKAEWYERFACANLEGAPEDFNDNVLFKNK